MIIPLPSVVFSIKKEVGTDDGHAHSHDTQDHQHEHHKSVHIINLIGPERRENKVPAQKEKAGNKTNAINALSTLKGKTKHSNTYISMNIDPNGRMPPRHTMTAGSMNLTTKKLTAKHINT